MFSLGMLAAIFFISSIYFIDTFGISAGFFLFLGIIVCAIIKGNRRGVILLASLAVLLGVLRYGAVMDAPLMRRLPDKYVTADGIIFSQPSETLGEYKYRYTLKLDTVSYIGTTYKVNQRIVLNSREHFEFGDRVRIRGFLSQIPGANNEYEYDFSTYYKSVGVHGRIVAREAEKLGTATIFTPEFLSGKLKAYISARISQRYPGRPGALLRAILINDKSGIDSEYREKLVQTGVYRTLYSPFMHISFIFLLSRFLFKSRQNREQASLILLFLYVLFNGTSATAVKACAISVLMIFKKEIFGFSNKLDTLSVTVLALAVADPMLCFSSGFAVSVASTVLVYFSYKPIYRRLSGYFAKRGISGRRLCPILTVWFIFTIGIAPLSALLYNGISVYSCLFTCLMMPVCILLFTVSAPSIYLPFKGTFASVFATMVSLLAVDGFVRLGEILPFSFLRVKTPSFMELIIFYLLWWIFLRWVSGKLNTNKTKIIATVTAALITLSVLSLDTNTLFVNFVNVGQGDGAVLHTSRGETVIIDGGGAPDYEENYNIGKQVFVPYLISHGYAHIDVAILSHPHKDHAEGIVEAAKTLKINTLVMPDIDRENQFRQELEALSIERGVNIEYLMAGDEIRFKSGLVVRFLAPDEDTLKDDDTNAASLVAHVSYGEFDALFTGDSNGFAEELCPENIDILKVAHHGSDSFDNEKYASRLNPKYAVISVGEDNSYGLPDSGVINILSRQGTKILRTDVHGDIRFRAKKDGKIIYKTLKGE